MRGETNMAKVGCLFLDERREDAMVEVGSLFLRKEKRRVARDKSRMPF
jgi:hypothetical protein